MRARHPFRPSMRIRRGAEFQRAYRQGSRAKGQWMVVVAVENGLGETRLGLSIGKRIWKLAVRRNRVRRVFREAFRLSYPELPEGVDLVLIAAQPQLEPQIESCRRELVRLAHKAHRRYLEKKGTA